MSIYIIKEYWPEYFFKLVKSTAQKNTRQEPADLVIFTEEILNGKLHFFVQWKWVTFSPKKNVKLNYKTGGKKLKN